MSPKPLQDSYWSVHCPTGVLLVLLHRQRKALGPGLTRGVSWPIQLQTLAWLWGTRGRFRRPQRQPSVQERPGPRALTQLSVEQNKTWKTPSGQMRRRVTILDHSPRAVVLKAELGQKQDPWMTCGSNGICLECLPYSAAWCCAHTHVVLALGKRWSLRSSLGVWQVQGSLCYMRPSLKEEMSTRSASVGYCIFSDTN